jgi:two-component system CheB/CheR fusion protein
MESTKSYAELLNEINELRLRLEEANETIEAIRTGQIDALVVKGEKGHELYTLKTADQTYRVFIEKMAEGAVTLNRKGIILYSNSQFANMMKMPLSKVIGLSFHTFIPAEHQERINVLLERGWKEDCKDEVVLSGKDISLDFQLSLTTLELDEGTSLSIILTDLTHQKETQRQLKLNNQKLEEINLALKTSNEDLNQFAYAASHDLQEPLRKIMFYSQKLHEKVLNQSNSEGKIYSEKIISSSQRMKRLINDILSYSRLNEGNNSFQIVNLNYLMDGLLEDFDIMIQEKKAQISVGDLGSIEAEPAPLRQVFQNLLNNALKFSKPSETPVITVTSQITTGNALDSDNDQSDSYCWITVKDNGIGFNEKYKEGIFTLFRRLHSKDEYEGTGIGLAITKRIVEKHRCHIIAKSEEGIGTELIVILPVRQKPLENASDN